MKRFNDVSVPAVNGLEVMLSAPNSVTMKGTITLQDASGALAGFFRALDGRAREERFPDVHVDVSGLKFVNSSAIRLFVDWAMWVHTDPRYKLRFRIDRRVTWQKTSFSALLAMAGDSIAVAEVD